MNTIYGHGETMGSVKTFRNMAHAILAPEPTKKKRLLHIKLPNLQGRYGFSINVGTKALFIGVAVANIEVETVTKTKRYKLFSPIKEKTQVRVVPI